MSNPPNPPLSNVTDATSPIPQTPTKPRISLDQTSSPATPPSPDTPHTNAYVTASSTPSTQPRQNPTTISNPQQSLQTSTPLFTIADEHDLSTPSPKTIKSTNNDNQTAFPAVEQTPQSLSKTSASTSASTSTSNRTPPRPANLITSLHGWHRPTRPRSPDLRLAAAAAARAAAAKSSASPSCKKTVTVKPRPSWPAGNTVPKSPNFRTSAKPLSAEAAQRRAQLLQDEVQQKEEEHKREKRLKERRAVWAKTRTLPKSPALQGKKSEKVPEKKIERTFVPIKMPDFGDAPLVRPTRKSLAHAQWNKDPGGTVAERNMKERRIVPYVLERTTPRPFSLLGVEQHDMIVERREAEKEKRMEEEKRKRTFRPVILREDILEGPTFAPSRSAVPLTTPVDLLPLAQERKERTEAFLRRQRERMEEMERLQKLAREEREQRELERLQKTWEERRFMPRPVPKSHYMPDIEPVGSRDGSRLAEVQRLSTVPEVNGDAKEAETKTSPGAEIETNVAPVAETESPTASETEASLVAETEAKAKAKAFVTTVPEAGRNTSPNSQPLVRRSSILDGLRKSLSPLLGPPGSPVTQVMNTVSRKK